MEEDLTPPWEPGLSTGLLGLHQQVAAPSTHLRWAPTSLLCVEVSLRVVPGWHLSGVLQFPACVFPHDVKNRCVPQLGFLICFCGNGFTR